MTIIQFADNHPFTFVLVVYILAISVVESVCAVAKIFRKRP